jgi:hypothetical protein
MYELALIVCDLATSTTARPRPEMGCYTPHKKKKQLREIARKLQTGEYSTCFVISLSTSAAAECPPEEAYFLRDTTACPDTI